MHDLKTRNHTYKCTTCHKVFRSVAEALKHVDKSREKASSL
jgi:uncharacterized C2H2 Zn-finger protein